MPTHRMPGSKKRKKKKEKSGAGSIADFFGGILGDTVKKVRKRKKKIQDATKRR